MQYLAFFKKKSFKANGTPSPNIWFRNTKFDKDLML